MQTVLNIFRMSDRTCDKCGKVFSIPYKLNMHKTRKTPCDLVLLAPNDDAEFSCKYCHRPFTTRQAMQLHIKKSCKAVNIPLPPTLDEQVAQLRQDISLLKLSVPIQFPAIPVSVSDQSSQPIQLPVAAAEEALPVHVIPEEQDIPPYLFSLTSGLLKAVIATKNKAEEERLVKEEVDGLSPQRLGLYAELKVSAFLGIAHWSLIPKWMRSMFHGGGSPSDHGVDAVGLDGSFYQVKWCRSAFDVNAAVAKLNNISESFISIGGSVSRRVIIAREGNQVSVGVSASKIDVIYLDDSVLYS